MHEEEDNTDVLKRYTQKCMARISLHTSLKLKELYNDLKVRSPDYQISYRKALLSKLPHDPMRLDIYMSVVDMYLKNNHVGFTSSEFETVLYKLGVVKDGKVSRSYNPDLVEKVLSIL